MSLEEEPSAGGGDVVRFGPFALSVPRRELRRDGRMVEIGQRGMDLLLTLLADPGAPVAKDRLLKAAWRGRAVEDSNLTVQIATLRRRLSVDANDPEDAQSLIRTVPGFGYVFTGAVSHLGRAGSQASRSPGAPIAHSPGGPVEPLTHFIGRDSERHALSLLLQANRLVTLAGMGGVGKTRLAMRLQRELSAAYADGVALVDLAPLAAAQVDEAVAAAVGAGGGEMAAEFALVAALRGREQLLILDNAEHVSASVTRLLQRLLPACPKLTVLVTSRDSLGLPGEVVFRLSPLDLPPPQTDRLSAAAALGYDAVRLLVDRAQALRPGFELRDEEAEDAADICRRLDGIALAIEMAVPRLEVLSLRQLAERLQDRFGATSGPRHNVPPRQRTLRAMFDWSWDLLAAPEQRLLQLLAIPAAGTTLEGIETLAIADGLVTETARHDVLNHLTRLAQSSLVTVTVPRRGSGADLRYRLLETTRQYALELLPPEGSTALSRLQGQLLAALFERANAEWPTTNSTIWLDRYEPEADNLRASLQWAFSRPDESPLALRLTAASFSLWWELPGLPLREARSWYALALSRIQRDTPPQIEARLRLGHSWNDTLDGDIANFPAVDQAVNLFRAADDRVGLGASLWRAASTVIYRDHTPSASALLDEALVVLERLPPSKWLVLCHVLQADLLQTRGALLPALAQYDRAFSTMKDLRYGYGLMVCGGNRSYALFELGRVDEAISALRDLLEETPPNFRHALLSLLAIMQTAAGRDEEARSSALQSLSGTVTTGLVATLARSIEALALLTARIGDPINATRLLGFALARHPANRTRLGPRRAVFHSLQAIQAASPLAEREHLLAEGAGWSEGEAVAAAMSLSWERPMRADDKSD